MGNNAHCVLRLCEQQPRGIFESSALQHIAYCYLHTFLLLVATYSADLHLSDLQVTVVLEPRLTSNHQVVSK